MCVWQVAVLLRGLVKTVERQAVQGEVRAAAAAAKTTGAGLIAHFY